MNRPDELSFLSRKGAVVLGGAHGSLAIARSLGRRGVPVWFITADNPLPELSRYVERSLAWPGPRGDSAMRFLIDVGHRYGLDGWVLFAGSDEDMRFVAQNHSTLSNVFTLTTPTWDRARWAYDKRRMHARAAELGIAHPLTFYPQGRDDLAGLPLPFPVILKPSVHESRNAFVDSKAWRVDAAAELFRRYDEAKSLVGAGSVMIQELIPGDGRSQFSYAALWDRGRPVGALVAQRRRQYPVQFGFTSTFVETVEVPEIEAAATRFLASLDFTGLVEVEFKYDARVDAYKMLDVNARAWTWLGLGAAAGIDFPALQWRLAVGDTVAPAVAQCGVSWRYLSRDVTAVLAEIASGRLSPVAALRSLHHSSAAAVFAWDDPVPGLFDMPLSALRMIKRRLARRSQDSVAAAALPPAKSAA
jgi:predicted ATP-grasp superfamily ATP-dependent carboligase